MAIGKILYGKTPKFPITNHISTKPIIQARIVVSCKVNFLERIKIIHAKHKDQIPQTATLTACSGNVRLKF